MMDHTKADLLRHALNVDDFEKYVFVSVVAMPTDPAAKLSFMEKN